MNRLSNKNKSIEVLAIGTSNLLVSRGTPMRVSKLLNGLADKPNINLRVVSSDEINPVPGSKHIRISKGFFNIAPKIIENLREKDADIIIGHTLGSIRYLFLSKFLSRGKILLETHGFIAEEAYLLGNIGYLKYKINKLIHNFFFWFSDVVTTSSPTGTKIVSAFNKNSHTIFNGADIELFNPDSKPTFNFRTNDNNIVIGYAGNSQIYQGLNFLLKAFAELLKIDERYKLALLLSDNRSVVQSTDSVTIVNSLPHNEVPGFFASCDILVVPRPPIEVARISFASKLLEYMSMGKPVISSNIGDADVIITSEKNGILYSPDNISEFITSVQYLSDPLIRKNIGIEARNLIVSKYSNEETQKSFYNLINMVYKI